MRFANGYGSIINLGKKRRKPFAVRITCGYEEKGEVNGVKQYRQKYKYIGYFEKRAEALACLVEYNKNPYGVSNKTTFNEVYTEWSKRKYDKIAISTAKNYTMLYRKCEKLYNLPFKELKTAHLQSIVDENKTASYVASFKVFFSQLYAYALKHDICDKNYSEFIDIPKVEKKSEKIPFTKKEIAHIWAMQGHIVADMLLVLLYTGMRIMELVELKTENVNIAERYFFVHKSKTPSGIRFVPIHKDILPIVQRHFNTNKPCLFVNNLGRGFGADTFRKDRFNPFAVEHNINHTLHEARHTFISQAHRLNINRLSVKRIVGHSDSDITEHYTATNKADLLNAIDLFNY